MVFRHKSDVNGLRIGLPFLEPEKMSFAITKTLQVWVSVFAFVVYNGCLLYTSHSLTFLDDSELF